jgi:hypothetical protein
VYQLCNLKTNISQKHNLANENPEKLKEMILGLQKEKMK